MSTEDTARGAQKLVGGGLLVAISLGIAQVLAYAQTLVAARTLTPAQFGAFSALLALLLIGNTVAVATQAVTARHIVASDPAHRADETAAAWRTTLQAAVLTMAFWLLISPLVGIGLRLDTPATYILLGLTFFPLTVMGGALGIAQGQEQHGRLAAVYLAVGVPKALVTIGFLLALATLTAGMTGLALGCALGAIICWVLVRGQFHGGQVRHSTMLREIPAAAYAMLALFALTNLDIVLGRAFLTDTQAGEYGVGIIIAKVVTWLPQFVAVMAYARMVDARRGRTTLVGLSVVGAIGAVCTLAIWAAPDLVVSVIAGPEYADMASLLPLFALIGACGAVLQFVVFGLVAIRDRGLIPLIWAGCAALIGLVALWHDSVGQVALIMLSVVGTVAAIGVWRLVLKRNAPALEGVALGG
jgi:O-antigen/teichoic acid export membrane protein